MGSDNRDRAATVQAPTIFVVLGATGDLMARKLGPALYNLFQQGSCPEQFHVVGLARRQLSQAEFAEHVAGNLQTHADIDLADDDQFLRLLQYQPGDFNDAETYTKLQETLEAVDKEWGVCSNKLFYLAVPPSGYETIFQQLSDSGLMDPCDDDTGWSRVLVEKPFGSNLEHAVQLEKQLDDLFNEEQIYRIDHYLGKEAVRNILAFRFSNNFLEQSWDNAMIDNIEIRLREEIDVEDRGSFYDKIGALLDVGQNHLLQLLALVTMEHPRTYAAQEVRDQRAKALEALVAVRDVDRQTARAQYEGYRQTDGVDFHSETETYFRVRTSSDLPHLRGVPIIMDGGKALKKTDKQVIVTFKHPSPCLCPDESHDYQNQLFIKLAPEPEVAIRFWAKQPGTKMELEEQWLRFDYRPTTDQRYLAEYTDLLMDAMVGDQTLFVSSEEALASWRFISPIIERWHQEAGDASSSQPELTMYQPGSQPEEFLTHVDHTPAARKQIGIVGLGKMGSNIARRLQERQWQVTGFDPEADNDFTFNQADSYSQLLQQLDTPRVIWLMVPHQAVDDVLFGTEGLAAGLQPGDIIIDGGNSFYEDSARRAERLAQQQVRFLDVGVSGGPRGARQGASLMIGGERDCFEELEPLFADLAVSHGYEFLEEAGAGHFVKMVHNGIEYGMMQAIAEGFHVLKESDYQLDLNRIASVYDHGSVIESRLIRWLEEALRLYGSELEKASGSVAHSGEGAWTVETARQLGVETKIIEGALEFRKASARNPTYAGQILTALRHQFGGHSLTGGQGQHDD